jgi:hypothetical protein
LASRFEAPTRRAGVTVRRSLATLGRLMSDNYKHLTDGQRKQKLAELLKRLKDAVDGARDAHLAGKHDEAAKHEKGAHRVIEEVFDLFEITVA